jgi:hypothetical protein
MGENLNFSGFKILKETWQKDNRLEINEGRDCAI